MKNKYLVLVALLILGAVLFSACGVAATPSSAAVPSSEADPENNLQVGEWPDLAVELVADVDDGTNIIQVPALVMKDGGELPAGAQVVNDSMAYFCQDYEAYVDGSAEGSCEIKTTVVENGQFIQVIILRNFFPTYGTDGDLEVFVYDLDRDMLWTLDNLLTTWEADTKTADAAIAKGDYLEEPMELKEYTCTGIILTGAGPALFYEVVAAAPEGDDWKHLYAAMPDGSVQRSADALASL